ncbi:unnamed protein product [Lactuca saligna]|uniref:Uncharacterized protein n=1 Tax=Lactuca saligna TaxID=75948 RepID=A0AA35VDD3_LACSI|nr:unnamed protein product [Lactuca saligna]
MLSLKDTYCDDIYSNGQKDLLRRGYRDERVMIHQPAGSLSKVATREFILEVGELLKLRKTLTRVYVKGTGKLLWVVSEDMAVKLSYSLVLDS